ncbi:hypothetical protein BXT95_24595 [Escherichia coli]|nr:hypothetical protein BXT95_24595 [Escherichia coli]
MVARIHIADKVSFVHAGCGVSASGDFAFVIRLNPGMIARISIKISDEQRSLRSQSSRLSADGQLQRKNVPGRWRCVR